MEYLEGKYLEDYRGSGSWTERALDDWRSNTMYIESYNHELNVCRLNRGEFAISIPLAIVLEMRKGVAS